MASRANSLEEFKSLMGKMITMDEVLKGLSVKLRPTDVVITPFGKCGTTWLQQMVHTLRSHGDEDYDDVSRVVPWIETAGNLGLDLNAEQKAEPRAFKSHLAWDLVPKGGRYIVSIRDPRDALVSMFRFMEGWFIEQGSVAIADFARKHYMVRGDAQDYWHHLRTWLSQRDNPDVLVLAYERMNQDREGTVRRVAEFIDIKLGDELLALTLDRTSLDYMLRHKHQFDDLLMRTRSEDVCGLPKGGDSAKVRKGEVGSHQYELSEDVIREVDAIWHEEITNTLGYADYAALLATFE